MVNIFQISKRTKSSKMVEASPNITFSTHPIISTYLYYIKDSVKMSIPVIKVILIIKRKPVCEASSESISNIIISTLIVTQRSPKLNRTYALLQVFIYC